MKTKTIAVDFDGVIHRYDGWKGPDHYNDEPVAGAPEFLLRLIEQGCSPVIFTTRSGPALGQWLKRHLPTKVLESLVVTSTKPPAWLYIDDRCFLFTGRFPSREEIENFKPWWEKSPQEAA